MNYFQYYQELTEKLLPIRSGTPIRRFKASARINRNATRVAYEDFAGRNMSNDEFNNLLKLCLNAEAKGSMTIWKQPKFTENGYFSVSRQGHITRIK